VHAKLTLSKRTVLRGQGDELLPLPAGFNAPGMGEACRFTRTLLQSDVPTFFKVTLDTVEMLARGGVQKQRCQKMLEAACAGVEEHAFKWFATFEQLPLLVFELGGPKSQLFAGCFLYGTYHSYSCVV
jgi:hypothetical protein